MDSASSSNETNPPAGKNALEWTIFAFSCLLVTLTLGVLIYETFIWNNTPPRLTVHTGVPFEQAGLTWIPVRVVNHGDQVARKIEVEVTSDAAEMPKAGFSIEELPGGAEQKGMVSFPSGKSGSRFTGRVSGYQTD